MFPVVLASVIKIWFFVSFFLRLCSEVPLLEDTLMRILVIGLSRDLPLGPADAMELADHLVKRAAGVQSDGKQCFHYIPSGAAPRQKQMFYFIMLLPKLFRNQITLL